LAKRDSVRTRRLEQRDERSTAAVSERSQLCHREKLREAGIEIPNPQRDLHIRSGVLKVENAAANNQGMIGFQAVKFK